MKKLAFLFTLFACGPKPLPAMGSIPERLCSEVPPEYSDGHLLGVGINGDFTCYLYGFHPTPEILCAHQLCRPTELCELPLQFYGDVCVSPEKHTDKPQNAEKILYDPEEDEGYQEPV